MLNAGQKYCRMLQGEHSAILSTFIKLPFVSKIFVLSIFEWPLKTGFTVCIQGSIFFLGPTHPAGQVVAICYSSFIGPDRQKISA